MNINIPTIKCSILIENFAPNGSIINKHCLTSASIELCRNTKGDCVFSINNKNNKEVKRFTFLKNQENYRLSTKFVTEGKCSILLPDLNLRIYISNCPPNDLSLFLKGFVLKCNYYSKQNKNENVFGIMTKQAFSLKNDQNSNIEKISPLTTKDVVKNLACRDSLFNANSPVSSKKTFQKRKLNEGNL